MRRTICVGLVVVAILLGYCGVQPTSWDDAPRRITAGEEAASSMESTSSREEFTSAEEGPNREETAERSAPVEDTTPAPPATTEGQGTVEASAAELLPDVDPQAPEGLRVGVGEDGGFLLSFDAKFDNVGAGPLHIDGHRRGSSGPMAADQVVHRSDGSTEVNPVVGELLDITDVPEGDYHLVHRVNAELRESDYSNNASSVLLKLRWPNGSNEPPAITVLASCADGARCSPEQAQKPPTTPADAT